MRNFILLTAAVISATASAGAQQKHTITFDDKGGTASLKGTANIKRLDFGVGQGEWKETTWIANEVKVVVDIQAQQASAPAAK